MAELRQIVIVCTPPGKRICGRQWESRTVVQVLDFDGERPAPARESLAKVVISTAELKHIATRAKPSFFSVEDVDDREAEHALRARQTEALDATLEAKQAELEKAERAIEAANRELEAGKAVLDARARELGSVKKKLAAAKKQLSELDKKRSEG